ncbi:DUF21-domain-containing protein [Neoconidiobolus thromboides FSU 785]|nr:DUF21-domain-containing protein [Neoconidiobolus thromboides FSU 785]
MRLRNIILSKWLLNIITSFLFMLQKSVGLSIHLLEEEKHEASLWKLFLVIFLVALGGLLAGLTLGLMSLDKTNLQILSNSQDEQQRRWALRILPIRENGHLLLVTMMLANTLTNMSLPILIESMFGSGLSAVIISTILILIFGEVIPQAVCARHGLRIGAFFAWPVRLLIIILYPISYPFAYTLDYLLGENHGVMYRRAELKELVAIHGSTNGGSLSHDEVTIIRGALDLSYKKAKDIMTSMKHVFMVDLECELNWITLRDIYRAGHSRIPVYCKDRNDIIGLLLTKSLIMLKPNVGTPLKMVKIYNIPKVSEMSSLFDLLNTFQEGTSHMAVVVSDNDKSTPLGIITLEDVLEELIQEEIIDETDVYIDVANRIKAIRKVTENYQSSRASSRVQSKLSQRKLKFKVGNKLANEVNRNSFASVGNGGKSQLSINNNYEGLLRYNSMQQSYESRNSFDEVKEQLQDKL